MFTKEGGRVRGFLRGTPADPGPLPVITPDDAAEYAGSKKPVAVADSGSLARISLRVSGSTFSDSIQARLDAWLGLLFRDGRKSKWRPAWFAGRYQTIQEFIEVYGRTRHSAAAACTRADPRPRHAPVRHPTQPASPAAQTVGNARHCLPMSGCRVRWRLGCRTDQAGATGR